MKTELEIGASMPPATNQELWSGGLEDSGISLITLNLLISLKPLLRMTTDRS